MRNWSWSSALLALLGVQAAVHADILSVRALPARAAATSGVDFTIEVNWQVTLAATDSAGARSAGAIFVNAATGAPLGLAVPTTIGSVTGGGVQITPELVTIPGATLAAWQQQGVRRIGYRRAFINAITGRSITGQLLIDLSKSSLESLREPTPGQLRVLRMELVFDSGKRIEIAAREAKLAAKLTVSFAGGGTLRGRWQVAEPGGGANPFFRTLSLVRESLAPTERATIASPRLPTNLAGRYALRFCLDVETAAPDDGCADSSAGVQTLYEVSVPDGAAAIHSLVPAGGAAGPGSVFRWSAVKDTAIYQLQILRTDPAGGSDFITGLLVPGASPSAVLSQLTLAKLVAGDRYRWRVTAHDAEGALLARSESAEFVYRP